MNRLLFFIAVVPLLFSSCNEKEARRGETATSGYLQVSVDAAYLPVFLQEKEVFQFLYPKAIIKENVVSQETSHKSFLNDSLRLFLSARRLDTTELTLLKKKKVYPRQYEFGWDALVLIVKAESEDTAFSLPYLKGILTSRNQNAERKVIVVENSTGANMVSLVQNLGLGKDSLYNIYSADSVQGVMSYVAEHPNAIGLVGSSWIIDKESKFVKKWLSQIKIARVSRHDKGNSYYPFQQEISDSLYPLLRCVYLISRETNMGLSNGFAAFMLGDNGQRILLKAGLLPSRMPQREIELTKKDLF